MMALRYSQAPGENLGRSTGASFKRWWVVVELISKIFFIQHDNKND